MTLGGANSGPGTNEVRCVRLSCCSMLHLPFRPQFVSNNPPLLPRVPLQAAIINLDDPAYPLVVEAAAAVPHITYAIDNQVRRGWGRTRGGRGWQEGRAGGADWEGAGQGECSWDGWGRLRCGWSKLVLMP